MMNQRRAELEGLVRSISTRTRYRTQFKARIVLMAADGAATRAIARDANSMIGCPRNGGCAVHRTGRLK
jgi:transposase-like protein